MIVLGKKDIGALLSMTEVLEALELGFREYKEGACVVPLRFGMEIREFGGEFLYMPAYLPGIKRCGAKIVSVFPGNASQGKPTIYASYLLHDAASGELLAIMDASALTGMRTGGASALATRYLARPDARILGIVGTGFQALYQVRAIMAVRPIERVLAYDQDRKKLDEFCRLLADLVPACPAPDPVALVRESEIIVTATTSPTPVFPGREVKPGTHINAIGAYRPNTREIDEDVITRAKIVVDTFPGALSEGGDIMIPLKEAKISPSAIHADLGDLVTGRKPGRESEEEVTLFKSVGFAMEDIVVAHRAYEKALQKGIGAKVSLE
jgi:alanine dehydrogenase